MKYFVGTGVALGEMLSLRKTAEEQVNVDVNKKTDLHSAIRNKADSLILAHNHSSGDPIPSPLDFLTTKMLVEVGNTGSGSYYCWQRGL